MRVDLNGWIWEMRDDGQWWLVAMALTCRPR